MKCMYMHACMYVCIMYVRMYQKLKIIYLTPILDSYEDIPVAYETMYCMI